MGSSYLATIDLVEPYFENYSELRGFFRIINKANGYSEFQKDYIKFNGVDDLLEYKSPVLM